MHIALNRFPIFRGSVPLVVLFLLCALGVPLSAQTMPTYYLDGTNGPNVFPLASTTNKTQHNYLPNEFTGAYSGNITRIWLKRQ